MAAERWMEIIRSDRTLDVSCVLQRPDIAWLASEESGLKTGALIDFDQSIIGGGDAPIPAVGEYGID